MSADSTNMNTVSPWASNMDFALLRASAIDFLQQHNTTLWTDYNYHDPGVTILEQLCFALTDLAFRTDFCIADLLQKQNDDTNNAFPGSLQLLNSFPVRKIDIRKIILDSLYDKDEQESVSNKIYNAWVIQEDKNIYSVEIQLNTQNYKKLLKHDGGLDEPEKRKLEKKIAHLLGDFRGLCTDFGEIKILNKDEIVVTGNINIKNGYVPEKVLANIYTQLDAFINPNVPFYTLSELLDQNIPVEKIYEGPALKKGFILDDDLKDRPLKIDVSAIRSIIFKTEGVSGIGNIRVNGEENEYEIGTGTHESSGHKIKKENCYPLLKKDLVKDKVLELSKNGAKISLNALDKLKYNTFLSELNSKINKPSADQKLKCNFRPKGNFRDVEKYYSIQKYFPAVYGIGDFGLPANVFVNETGLNNQQSLDTRNAQAKQLKAYLMLFEQVIADYLSQLANIDSLFSAEFSPKGRTYFTQSIIDQVPNAKSPKVPNGIDIVGQDELQNYIDDLQKNSESDLTYLTRKEMFLDHLLARVNEKLDSYPFMLYDSIYGAPHPEKRHSKVLSAKARYLKMYCEIGYNRNKAFDCYGESLGTENISGLETKIAHLLGIDSIKKRELHKIEELTVKDVSKGSSKKKNDGGEVISDLIFIDIETTEELVIGNEIIIEYTTDDEIIIEENGERHSKNDNKGFHFNDTNSSRINTFFRNGMYLHNYRIGRHKNKNNDHEYFITFFNVADDPAHPEWIKIHTHTNKDTANSKLNALVAYVAKMNKSSEGFHMVEHILLGDHKPNDISIVLPLWPARFQDTGFQYYLQQLFTKHAPVYVKLNFIWLDLVYMGKFEDKYFSWLKSLTKNAQKPKEDTTKELIEFLKERTATKKEVKIE